MSPVVYHRRKGKTMREFQDIAIAEMESKHAQWEASLPRCCVCGQQVPYEVYKFDNEVYCGQCFTKELRHDEDIIDELFMGFRLRCREEL